MKFGTSFILALFLTMPLGAQVRIDAPPQIWGFAPNIRVYGLAAGETVRIHMVRGFTGWETDDPTKASGWKPVKHAIHAWVDARADKSGTIDLANTTIRKGTYKGKDPYGLWWSGRKSKDALLANIAIEGFDPTSIREGESRILVSRDGQLLASIVATSRAPEGLRTAILAEGTLNGAYAAPKDGKRHPSIILLHGSEGGDRDAAMALAQRFAGQGFAAFALNYFAWDLKQLTGIPNNHVNQPIELLEQVKSWLAIQPEADVTRVGVYGHSKGAEFAAVAATYYPWIRAVAACVPSDAVWEGYGIGDARNRPDPAPIAPEQISSWSWQGQPLPYIALPAADDRSAYFNNTAYYEARRAADPVAADAARIHVERSDAKFLWLGGGRDEVWASAAMGKRNHLALQKVGKGSNSELRNYPKASHAICGDGTYPTRLWAEDSADPRKPNLDADGYATVDAWNRIVTFFRRSL